MGNFLVRKGRKPRESFLISTSPPVTKGINVQRKREGKSVLSLEQEGGTPCRPGDNIGAS